MNRVALFIDGAALYWVLKRAGWRVDFQLMHQLLTKGKSVYGAFYFGAAPPEDDERARNNYRRFRRALLSIGYHVFDKEVKVIVDPKTGQKTLRGNLDLELAVRMMEEASGYDEAILIGGDADYVPVVKHLANIGKRITLVGVREATSQELINSASHFLDLNELRSYIERGAAVKQPEDAFEVSSLLADALKPPRQITTGRSTNLLKLHPVILKVSSKAYATENYDYAVLNAFKAMEKYVKEKSGLRLSGQQLMARAFDERNPILKLNALTTESELSEQCGYKFLFMGVVGIRNLLAHEVVEWSDPEKAYKFLVFCSLLLERIDEAAT